MRRYGALSLVLASAPALLAQGVITTLAGTEFILPADRFPALAAPLGRLGDAAADARGNLYVSDEQNHVVVRISADGLLEVVAGNGLPGYSGDNGPAVNASLRSPRGVAVDSSGNLYIADAADHRVRKVSAGGIITTLAGTGRPSFSGDGGSAARAALNEPRGLAVDRAGNLYVADSANHRVRRVGSDGLIATVAGDGQPRYVGEGGPAIAAGVNSPGALAVDAAGNLYIADSQAVRMVSQRGVIQTVPGTSTASGLAIDASGVLYMASAIDNRVYRIEGGVARPFAGAAEMGFAGDGGAATSASLNSPGGLAFDGLGNLYIPDRENARLRRVDARGGIGTVAGSGQFRFSGDGSLAASATLNQPSSVALDAASGLLIADLSNNRVRRVGSEGTIATVAGDGRFGFSGDQGPARKAALNLPQGVAADLAGGNFYIADQINNRIRMVAPNGIISTFAGGGSSSAEGALATSVQLRLPWAVAVDRSGNVYIADSLSHRIRKVAPSGTITTIAGTGVAGLTGDGGPAISARLSTPRGVAVDAAGRVYVSDTGNNRIRVISTDGNIQTVAALDSPRGLALDSAGNLYVAEAFAHRVRRVSGSGVVATVAGTGAPGFSGDGGPAVNAQLDTPLGVAVDGSGNLYIADAENHRIRVVLASLPVVAVTPQSLSFAAQSGGPRAVHRVLNVTGSVAGSPYTVTVETEGGGEWLSVKPPRGTLPAAIEVNAEAIDLPRGVYRGTVRIAVPNAIPAVLAVPVTFNVTQSPLGKYLVEPGELVFHFVQGSPANTRTITLSSVGSAEQRFTAGASAEDGSWLTVSTPAGSAKASDPGSLMVTANPGRLGSGTYRGAVAITSATGGDPVSVPVTMTVSDVRHKILVSQTGLSFTAVAGGGVSAPQPLGILDEGDGGMSWAARAETLEGGNWLRLDSAAGRVDRALLDVSPLEVSVNAQGLAPGEYYGRITVTAPADNSPQMVTVLVTVLPEGSDPGPQVRPASLIFVGYPGVNPGSQNVVVSNLLRRPVNFGSSRTTQNGSPWLVHSPPNATLAPEGAVRMVVQPDYSNLTPGAWTGSITLQFEGAVRKVDVLGIVAPGAPGGRAAAGCNSPQLRVQLNSPSDGFTVMIGQPSTIEARVVDECGTPLVPDPSRATTEVVAVFNAAGESNLRLTHVGGGTWTGTWRPLVSGPMVATVSAILIQGSTRQIGVVQRSGTVQSGSSTPLVSPGSLVHAASFGAGFPVAPGGLITIWGANLSERVSVVREMPLPLQLDETEVVLGGQPLPILYSSDKQINAQVPYNLPVNTQHQVVVRRRNQISVPESFTVSAAQPGIFTKNQRGSGQGIIMKSDQRTLAEPATPAARGEAIVIYCAGLGAVNPPVGPGQPAPLPPAITVNPVTLTIGGQPAQVLFSGLTPGFAGLYQVNALMPQNVTPGDEVPVVLRVAGQTSPPVTMAVR